MNKSKMANFVTDYNFSGVAVGCGWQSFVAYVNVGCYYVVGVPLGSILAFKFNFGAKVLYIPHLLFMKLLYRTT